MPLYLLRWNFHNKRIFLSKYLYVKYILVMYFIIKNTKRIFSPNTILIKVISLARRRLRFLLPLYHLLPSLRGAINKLFSQHVETNRYYLKDGITPVEFFAALNFGGENYLMIRWWDRLQNWDNNEDFDILVANPNLDIWNKYLQFTPSSYKLDIYTDNGDLQGNGGVPYFPPVIFHRLLRNRKLYENLVYIPDKLDAYLAILFHMFFHKGATSGLKFLHAQQQEMDNRYKSFLNESEFTTPQLRGFTAQACFQALANYDFLPAEDLMLKYADKRPEIKPFLNNRSFDGYDRLFLLYLRETYFSERALSIVKGTLARDGYSVLFMENITKSQSKIVAQNIRGGNWGKGGYKVSAGVPKYWFIAIDRKETTDSEAYFKRRQKTKEFIRKELITQEPLSEKGNPVHSADTGDEIKHALELIASRSCKQITSYICAALCDPESWIKLGRSRTTWGDRKTQSVNKFFHVDTEKFSDQEIQTFEILASKNLAYNFQFRRERLFSYPMLQIIDEASIMAATGWADFFETLYLNKIVIPDLSWEQFCVDYDGVIKLVDGKYSFQVETQQDWWFWFNNGVVSYKKYQKSLMPVGYGTKSFLKNQDKFRPLKLDFLNTKIN
ncbi:hypothetical protein N9J58_00100 [bacterium]|nr:hypothetical protein [bacterium]